MTIELEGKREIDIGPPLVIGERRLFVVSERLLINNCKECLVFGMLISPVYVVIVEPDQYYAFSLLDGRKVDLKELFLKNPSLKEKLSLT